MAADNLRLRKALKDAGEPEVGDVDPKPDMLATPAPGYAKFTKAYTPDEKRRQADALVRALRDRQ